MRERKKEWSTPAFIITSSGMKVGDVGKDGVNLPSHKDLYLDCRACYDPSQHSGTGDDTRLQLLVRDRTPITAYMEIVKGFIDTWPNRRMEWQDPFAHSLTIHCFCAWGMHRSRAMKHIIADELRRMGYTVETV